MRRRPHARERDEAGGEPEGFQVAGLPSGHQDQYGPDRYFVLEQLHMMRFNGQSWELFGPMLSATTPDA